MATPPSNGDDPGADPDGPDESGGSNGPDRESTDGDEITGPASADDEPSEGESAVVDPSDDGADGAASGRDPGDADGVDYAWVMETTFVLAILVGVPVVAALAAFRPLPTWEARVGFAVRVGAVVWILTALGTYAYARRADGGSGDGEAGDGGSGSRRSGDGNDGSNDDASRDAGPG